MPRCDSLHFFHPIRIECWWALVRQVGCRPTMKWQSPTSFTTSLSLLRPSTPLELGVGGRWSTKRGVDSTLWDTSHFQLEIRNDALRRVRRRRCSCPILWLSGRDGFLTRGNRGRGRLYLDRKPQVRTRVLLGRRHHPAGHKEKFKAAYQNYFFGWGACGSRLVRRRRGRWWLRAPDCAFFAPRS